MKAIAILIMALAVATLHAEPQQNGSWVTFTSVDEMTDEVSEYVFTVSGDVSLIFIDEQSVVIDSDRIVMPGESLLIRIDSQDALEYEYFAEGSSVLVTHSRPADFIDAETIRARVPLVRGSGTYSWSAEGMREAFERFGWSVEQ